MNTKTAPIHFIMMFSPAASSLATRVGGGGGPFPEKYRYWYWASSPGGRSQPWLTCAAAGVFHLNVYDLVVLANTDFGIFASPSPSPGGRVALNDVMTWRDGVMLLDGVGAAPCHAIGLSSQLSGWLFRMQTAGSGQVPLRLDDAPLYLYCRSDTFSFTNYIYIL